MIDASYYLINGIFVDLSERFESATYSKLRSVGIARWRYEIHNIVELVGVYE